MEESDLPVAGAGWGEGGSDTSGDAAVVPGPHPADLSELPPSQRGIPRRTLVPWWTFVVAAASLLLVVGVAVAVPLLLTARTVEVPSVAGLTYDEAAAALEDAGLRAERGDELFSTDVEPGSVVGQDPEAGSDARRGSVVVLAVSAGSETFAMPDVVGRPIAEARQALADRGLAVRVEVVRAEAASGTVISTVPAPGATVTTADVVRVTVAGGGDASSALLPHQLEGLSIAIDPAAVGTSTVDAPLEVARRLRALLEASGATVTVTRSAADPTPPLKQRRETAKEATPTAVLGLSLAKEGEGGVVVLSPPVAPNSSSYHEDTAAFAQTAASELRAADRIVRVETRKDALLDAVRAPGIRVQLGSVASREDESAFRDPRWADEVARALYRAIGEVFAQR